MQFGGGTHFGGAGKFGGSKPGWIRYYNILKSLLPPGAYSDDDESIVMRTVRADAEQLAAGGESVVQALEREIFPDTAEASLPEWEKMLGIALPANATLATRQAACVSKWRASLGSSLDAIRTILDPLLNATTAFRDPFDDSSVSPRWEQNSHTSTITEADPSPLTGYLDIVLGAGDRRINATLNLGPVLLVPLHDRDDTFTVTTHTKAIVAVNEQGGGTVVYANANNWFHFGIKYEGGTSYLQIDQLVDGTYTENVFRTTPTTASVYTVIEKTAANKLQFKYHDTDPASVAQILEVDLGTMVPRKVGVFAKNYDGASSGGVEIHEISFSHGLSKNNIEIIEFPLSLMQSTTDTSKFTAFVHREPTDAGTYDIKETQRTLDRIKQAHTLLRVGESDSFKTDDPYSLTDRDLLGS